MITGFENIRLAGVEVYIVPDQFRSEQFRYPRSKRRRIRKKWRRDPANWRLVPMRQSLRMGNRLLVDRRTYDDLMAQIK